MKIFCKNAKILNYIKNINSKLNDSLYYFLKIKTKYYIIFNLSNQAVQYLIDNKIIENNDKEIANVLLTTDGISKDALNKYFASHKERN